jgi:hypothetical protein
LIFMPWIVPFNDQARRIAGLLRITPQRRFNTLAASMAK